MASNSVIVCMQKYCKFCNKEKLINEFSKNSGTKDGHLTKCKLCEKEYRTQHKKQIKERNFSWRNKNIEIIKENGEKYYISNKEKIKQQKQEYYKKNKQKRDEYSKKWAKEHPEIEKNRYKKYREQNRKKINQRAIIKSKTSKFKEYQKQWRDKNREKLREYYKSKWPEYKKKQFEYSKNRQKTDLDFRLKQRLRSRLKCALKRQRLKKTERTCQLTGCTIKQLIEYFKTLFYINSEGIMMQESDLFEKNVQIDHIIPCWHFDLTDIRQRKRCFYYTNLCPLWIEDHKKKSNKDYQEYLNWKRSGLPLEIYLDPEKRKKNEDPYKVWI